MTEKEMEAEKKFLGTKLTFDVPSAGFSAIRVNGGEPHFYVAINQDLDISTDEADAFVSRFCGSWNAMSGITDPEGFMREVKDTLDSIDTYGSDTLSGRTDGPADREWFREAVREMRNRARALLSQMEARD